MLDIKDTFEFKSDELVIREEPLFIAEIEAYYLLRSDIGEIALKYIKEGELVQYGLNRLWYISTSIVKEVMHQDLAFFEFRPAIFMRENSVYINIAAGFKCCDIYIARLCNYLFDIKKSLQNNHSLNLDV